MRPLISIIIPVYNVEKYLDKCMECICAQTYKNLEIIMVDDGSKDNSGYMCDTWKEKDSRIKVIHKKNGGLSDARNAGIDIMTGEYVTFVDSDDILAVNLIETLYINIKKYKSQISICDFVHCYLDKKFKYMQETFHKVYNAEDALCEMMYQTSFLVSACAKLYQTELFKNIRFPVGMLFEDAAIMYKIISQIKIAVYSNAKLYGYLHHNDSITTKKFSKSDCDITSICKEQLRFARNYSKKVYDAALAYQVASALRIYLNAPATVEFKREIAEAEAIIKKNCFYVLKNRHCRNKLRISLLLFTFCKPLMHIAYKYVDRWK